MAIERFANTSRQSYRNIPMEDTPKVESEEATILAIGGSQAQLLGIPPELRLMIYDHLFEDLLAEATQAVTPAHVAEILQRTILHICAKIRHEVGTKFNSVLARTSSALEKPLHEVGAAIEAELVQHQAGSPSIATVKSFMVKVEDMQALLMEAGRKMEAIIKILDALSPEDDRGHAEDVRAAMRAIKPKGVVGEVADEGGA